MGAEIDLSNDHAPIVVRGRRPLRPARHELAGGERAVRRGDLVRGTCRGWNDDGDRAWDGARSHRTHARRFGHRHSRTTDRSGRATTRINGPSGLRSFQLNVPGDFSSASAWLVAGALHADAHLRMSGVGLNPTRTALIDVLRRMGAEIEEIVTDELCGRARRRSRGSRRSSFERVIAGRRGCRAVDRRAAIACRRDGRG